MYAESANRPDIFVLQQYFLHAVADAVFLSHCVLECLTARTASFWSRRRKTNAVAARRSESVFTMLTSSVLLYFVLLGSCSVLSGCLMNRTQLVQTAVRTVSNLFQVHAVEKQTEAYSHDLVWLAEHTLSCTNPEFLYLSPGFFFLSQSVILSLLSQFCTRLPEKQVEQLPEACVQSGSPWLSHLNRLFSMRQCGVVNLQEPARTSPETTQSAGAPLSAFAQLVFWTIAPFRTHLSAPVTQQQVEKQTTARTWANVHAAPVTLEEAVPACWQKFVTHPRLTQIPQTRTHAHL